MLKEPRSYCTVTGVCGNPCSTTQIGIQEVFRLLQKRLSTKSLNLFLVTSIFIQHKVVGIQTELTHDLPFLEQF
jgi:hypothetical protein